MRIRIVLAIILLAVGLCFVPALGHGEIKQPIKPSVAFYMEEYKENPAQGLDEWRKDCDTTLPTQLDYFLLWAMTMYIMNNATDFQGVNILYDYVGELKEYYPKNVDTKGKICIEITDVRGSFSHLISEPSAKSRIALKEGFKGYLQVIYSYIDKWATNINVDIVAKFVSKGGIPLAYFYQGEYHLWKE